MINKLFLAPALLSVAGLLMGEGTIFAQHGHGHGGGGHHSSGHAYSGHAHHHGGHAYSGHSGGHYHHNHSGYYGGYGLGAYGLGRYGLGAYGYGLGGYGYGGYGPLYYAAPSYSYYYAPSNDAYVPSTDYYAPPPTSAVADYATVRVIVSDPQARVWFNGSLTSQNGLDRSFQTPSLTPGMNYSYRVRASWMQSGQPMVQEQVVSVTPGQTSVVDFTR